MKSKLGVTTATSVLFIFSLFFPAIAFPQNPCIRDRELVFKNTSVNGRNLNYWFQLMSYCNPYCNEEAISAFDTAIHSNNKLIPFLIDTLGNENEYHFASMILQRTDSMAVPFLIKALKKGNVISTRSANVLSLIKYHGDEIGAGILDCIKSKGNQICYSQIFSFSKYKDQSIPYLYEYLDNSRSYYRDIVSYSMLNSGESGIINVLNYIGSRNNLNISKFYCADSSDKLVKALLSLLDDTDDCFMEWLLLLVLGHFEDHADLVANKIECFLKHDRRNVVMAIETLSKVGGYGHDILIESFSREMRFVSVAENLGRFGSRGLPKLLLALESTNLKTRRGSILSIGCMGKDGKEATLEVLKHIHDSDDFVSKYSIWALGRIGRGFPGVEESLLDVLSNPEYSMDKKAAAAISIAFLGVKSEKMEMEIVNAIIEYLKSDIMATNKDKILLRDLSLKKYPIDLLEIYPRSLVYLGNKQYFYCSLVYALLKLELISESTIKVLASSISRLKSKKEIEYTIFALGEMDKHREISFPEIIRAVKYHDGGIRISCLVSLLKLKYDKNEIDNSLNSWKCSYRNKPIGFLSEEILKSNGK